METLAINDTKKFTFIFGATPIEVLNDRQFDSYLKDMNEFQIRNKALVIKGDETSISSELPQCVIDLATKIGDLDDLKVAILEKVIDNLSDYTNAEEPTKEDLRNCLEDLQNLQGGSWLIYSKDIYDFVFRYNEEFSDYINANDIEEYIERVDLSNGLISVAETLYFQVLAWMIGDMISLIDND